MLALKNLAVILRITVPVSEFSYGRDFLWETLIRPYTMYFNSIFWRE